MEERERRRKNIIIKRLQTDKGSLREEVRRLWKEMEVQAEIKEIRKVNKRKEEGKKMAVRDKYGKKEVIMKKKA